LRAKIEEAVAAGVDWIQIREKALPARDLAALTHSALVKASAPRPGAPRPTILVNDRLDVALAERAGGVHLGEKSIFLEDARKLAESLHPPPGTPFLFGVSCHLADAARAAANSGADYLLFGPIFATPSKAAYGPPQGLDRLAEVCDAVAVPVLAIGGITAENAASCLAAGASGIAAIRLFQEAADLPALVRTLRALALH
jgi:thiamine-phosphate pyrophosphorylase